MDPAIRALLAGGARRIGVTLSDEMADKLLTYVDLLLRWSRRVDLTSLKTPDAVVNRLVLDSLAILPHLPQSSTFVDVGSGGGIPGIPIKVVRPNMRVTLVEPRERRSVFLRTAIAALDIEADVICARLDDLRMQFDIVASKALLPPEKWLDAAKKLCRGGGTIAVWGRVPGRNPNQVITYDLPDGSSGRIELFHVKQ